MREKVLVNLSNRKLELAEKLNAIDFGGIAYGSTEVNFTQGAGPEPRLRLSPIMILSSDDSDTESEHTGSGGETGGEFTSEGEPVEWEDITQVEEEEEQGIVGQPSPKQTGREEFCVLVTPPSTTRKRRHA